MIPFLFSPTRIAFSELIATDFQQKKTSFTKKSSDQFLNDILIESVNYSDYPPRTSNELFQKNNQVEQFFIKNKHVNLGYDYANKPTS